MQEAHGFNTILVQLRAAAFAIEMGGQRQDSSAQFVARPVATPGWATPLFASPEQTKSNCIVTPSSDDALG